MNINLDNLYNIKQCGWLAQPLVIDKVASYIAKSLELHANDHSLVKREAQDLSAFMLSCRSVGKKTCIQKKMQKLKELFHNLSLSYWDRKYPLFANDWKPVYNKDFTLPNAVNIKDQFPLIGQPSLIVKVIKMGVNSDEVVAFEKEGIVSEKLLEQAKALLQTCKALYNCTQLKKFYSELKSFERNELLMIGGTKCTFPGGPGWLFDIFLKDSHMYFSGSNSNVTSRVCDYSEEEIEKDVKEIVKVFPESLDCNQFHSRLVNYHTPFHIACMNSNISLNIIEFLLKNKADPYRPAIRSSGLKWTINSTKYFLNENNEKEVTRFSEIKKLIEKHFLKK